MVAGKPQALSRLFWVRAGLGYRLGHDGWGHDEGMMGVTMRGVGLGSSLGGGAWSGSGSELGLEMTYTSCSH